MPPRQSFRGRFTREGRLRNEWAAAAAEPDPSRSLQRLRRVQEELGKQLAVFASLWPPFLETVLDGRLGPLLTDDDFGSLAATGEQMARGPDSPISLEEAWLPLVAARDARRQRQAALALLARLYWSPSATGATRATAARELALRSAKSNQHLAIYTDWLSGTRRRRPDPAIRGVLEDALEVGFDMSALQIRRAGQLAQRLREARIAIPGLDRAMGFHRLLVDHDDALAAQQLEVAVAADPTDEIGLVGLLSACLRGGDHGRAATVAGNAKVPSSRPVAEMIQLSRALAWLDDPGDAGIRPARAASLEAFGVAAQAGDWLPFAVGRMHLLEGNAKRAAEVLVPLADQHPEHPRWGYHAAWALLLIDDRHELARRFRKSRGWSGSWTVGCLLMDADPVLASESMAEPDPSQITPRYAPLAEVRVSLARGTRPPPSPAWQPGGGTLEEDLEALRTVLGQRFVAKQRGAMDSALGLPAFRRLPLAEQLLWSGLFALPVDPARGRALLDQAAHKLGYQRAALVLAVHHLEKGQTAQADRLLERFAWRVDPKLELLRAYGEVCAGREESAVARFERLAAQGQPRAQYAVGNLYLRRAAQAQANGRPDHAGRYHEQAAAAFAAALAGGAQSAPRDAEILRSCAELVRLQGAGTAACARHWPEVERWTTSRHHDWASWVVALARIADDPAAADLGACEHVVSLLESAESTPVVAAEAVVSALARACLSSRDSERVEALADLLRRLTRRPGLGEATRLHGLAVAAAAHRRWSGKVGHGQFDLDRLARAGTGNSALSILAAELALEDDDRVTAIHVLRQVQPEDDLERHACRAMADLLEGRAPPAELLPDPPEGAAPQVAFAVRVMQAAGLAERAPERCLDALVQALPHGDLDGIVDVGKSLPWLCANAVRGRVVPRSLAEMVRRLARSPGEGMDPLTLARCAAAVGELETANRLWQQVLASDPEATRPRGEEYREEYVGVLCHLAVVAREQGDGLEAVQRLRLAAHVAAGDQPGQRPAGAPRGTGTTDRLQPGRPSDIRDWKEVEALDGTFREATKWLRGRQRKVARSRWRTMRQDFDAAVSRGDDSEALRCSEEMERFVAEVAPQER